MIQTTERAAPELRQYADLAARELGISQADVFVKVGGAPQLDSSTRFIVVGPLEDAPRVVRAFVVFREMARLCLADRARGVNVTVAAPFAVDVIAAWLCGRSALAPSPDLRRFEDKADAPAWQHAMQSAWMAGTSGRECPVRNVVPI